jgi:hypothetical protein
MCKLQPVVGTVTNEPGPNRPPEERLDLPTDHTERDLKAVVSALRLGIRPEPLDELLSPYRLLGVGAEEPEELAVQRPQSL